MTNSDDAIRQYPRSVVAYDLETSGLSPAFDQIFQIAAVRTDDTLACPSEGTSILELRAKRQPWIVPSPTAMLVTRMDPSDIESGIAHHKMVHAIEKFFTHEPAIFVTYNGLRFDEQVLRNALYQSLCRPYLTHSGSSMRVDLMRMAQAIAVLDPHALTVPVGVNGRPTFRLGAICRANQIQLAEDDAHDALADVKATLAFGRHLKGRSPQIFEHLLGLAHRPRAEEALASGSAVIQLITILGKPIVRALGVIGCNAPDKNSRICVDLSVDPISYLDLPIDRLSQWIARRPSPLVNLRTNSQEIVFPVGSSDFAARLLPQLRTTSKDTAVPSPEILQERAALISADQEFVARIKAILAKQLSSRVTSPHVEAQLRDGFAPDSDYRTAYMARDLDPALRTLVGPLKDVRLRELSARMQYETESERMPLWARDAHDQWVAERLLSTSITPWRTIADARQEIITLSRDPEPENAARLYRIAAWLDALEADWSAPRLTGHPAGWVKH